MSAKIAAYTEDDAKLRDCPQRVGHPGMSRSAALCTASRCMAWRWAWWAQPLVEVDADGQKTVDDRGYCGLAGDPGGDGES